jgi:hypothetical protein
MRAVTNVYSLPLGKCKSERHMGYLSLSGMAAPYRRLVRTCFVTRSLASSNRIGANKRSRELTFARQCHVDARNRCVHTTQIKVHGNSYYGAHRLPAGKTAAERRKRDVLQVRLRNCSKIHDIDCPRRQSFFAFMRF